jgi:DNA-binding transcriptional ArsR family regulator
MTPETTARVEFVVSPRFDIFYALYALTSSARSTLDPWKAKTAAVIPRDFERLARRVAPVPLFWPLLADSLRDAPGAISFETIASLLNAVAPADLQRNILAGIFHDPPTVQSLLSRKKSLRQVLTDESLPGGELLSHFGLRPYTADSHAASAMTDLLTDPESYRERLSAVVERFWESTFKRQWNALEPVLRAEASRLTKVQRGKSVPALAEALNLPLQIDPTKTELRSTTGAAVRIAGVEACYVMPSAFNTRRWWARYETSPGRFTLYFPVASHKASPNDLAGEARRAGIEVRRVEASTLARAPRPLDPESVFRALGDTTRYAIASILARTPTTSAELARSLGVSKPTITHHVHALRSAGLITVSDFGGSVKLSLDRSVVEALSEATVRHLFASSGELQLATTRRRRR